MNRKPKPMPSVRINEAAEDPVDRPDSSQYSISGNAQQVEAQIKRMPASGKRFLSQEWSKQHPIDEAAQHLFAGQ